MGDTASHLPQCLHFMRFGKLPLAEVVLGHVLAEKEKPLDLAGFILVGHEGNGNFAGF